MASDTPPTAPPAPVALDPDGFNELRRCRSGPMLYNKHDIYVGGSLRHYAEFSVSEQAAFSQLVRPDTIAVEVGANIGGHTVHLSRLVGEGGEVHAFEPQRIPFQTLCANLALNQCRNVFARQTAVGARVDTILVPALDPALRENFGGISLHGVEVGEPVPLVTLDSLDLPACHFLKADVEGMEVDVLKGALQTIDMYRPMLYLENDRDDRSEELLSLVMGLDYAVFWHIAPLFNPDNFAREPNDVFGGIVSINILCVPNENPMSIEGLPRVQSPTDSWRKR